MKRSILLIPLFIVFAINTHAQTIGPATVNATGGWKTIGADEFEWSVGEMALVSTFTGTSIIVTQGVLQPYDGPTKIESTSLLKDQLRVFPNPTTSVVNVQYTSAGDGILTYRLMDIAGKVINTATTDVKQGTTSEQVNVSALACATYMLEITVTTGNDASEKATYKIQKLK